MLGSKGGRTQGGAAGTQLPALGLQTRGRLTRDSCPECGSRSAGPLLAFDRRVLEPGTSIFLKGKLQK